MIDIEYSTIMCREAYNLHGEADVSRINKWGGFDIEYPRLAIIDGDADPWVEATPHATGTRPRRDTLDKPFLLIPGGIHHCKSQAHVRFVFPCRSNPIIGDENGVFPNQTTPDFPPKPVQKVQAREIEFVKKWLKGESTSSI